MSGLQFGVGAQFNPAPPVNWKQRIAEGMRTAGRQAEWVSSYGFDTALCMLRTGKKVARIGWHAKELWLMLPSGIQRVKLSDGVYCDTPPFIVVSSLGGNPVPWCPSQIDLLATDWVEA